MPSTFSVSLLFVSYLTPFLKPFDANSNQIFVNEKIVAAIQVQCQVYVTSIGTFGPPLTPGASPVGESPVSKQTFRADTLSVATVSDSPRSPLSSRRINDVNNIFSDSGSSSIALPVFLLVAIIMAMF